MQLARSSTHREPSFVASPVDPCTVPPSDQNTTVSDSTLVVGSRRFYRRIVAAIVALVTTVITVTLGILVKRYLATDEGSSDGQQ